MQNMPAVSQAQYRFMEKIAKGEIKSPGLTPEKAKEFIAQNHSIAHLPEHVSAKRAKRIKSNYGK